VCVAVNILSLASYSWKREREWERDTTDARVELAESFSWRRRRSEWNVGSIKSNLEVRRYIEQGESEDERELRNKRIERERLAVS